MGCYICQVTTHCVCHEDISDCIEKKTRVSPDTFLSKLKIPKWPSLHILYLSITITLNQNYYGKGKLRLKIEFRVLIS